MGIEVFSQHKVWSRTIGYKIEKCLAVNTICIQCSTFPPLPSPPLPSSPLPSLPSLPIRYVEAQDAEMRLSLLEDSAATKVRGIFSI